MAEGYQRAARTCPEPIATEWVGDLLAAAARAPSILNTQPWLFRVTTHTIELYADPSRRLRSDPNGREMLISCGAALFGLRFAIRALGYQPMVSLLPDPERPSVLATVQFGARQPVTDGERRLIEALPHRHTRRGGYVPGPLPRGLLIGLQHDAVVEHASLALIDRPAAYSQLAAIVAKTAITLNADERSVADARHWVRLPGSTARDGVPASAIPAQHGRRPAQRQARLAQRDLDLGRGIGELDQAGPPPAATAILLTPGDTRADWLRAGQALHRLLAHAAGQWVFASLNSQPLESAPVRALIRSKLGLPGAPQLLLEFGLAKTARPTARRSAAELLASSRPR
jgi:nitroreductase